MTVTERVAYLKGLAEGLALDSTSKEGKLLSAIIDVLDDMAFEICDTQELIGELGDQVDMMDEDLDALEEIVYDDEGCCCDCDCEDCDDEECDCEDELYEVVCPSCGDQIYLDENMILEGELDCPNCGEFLELDFDGLVDEDTVLELPVEAVKEPKEVADLKEVKKDTKKDAKKEAKKESKKDSKKEPKKK